MPSNINPSLTPTNSLDNFRFWCQKVLPLVYDDSLSYYEVLGKMVVQLNDVIDDVNADIENVDTLKDAFLALQTYVNEFFDDIDQLASYAERAETAQTAANASAINAASSASNASASSLAAMNARDAAVTAKEAAEASASTASTAATNATTKAGEAAQSAINAQTAQASASQSATLADTARSAAQTAASTATTKASEASTSATNAETSASNAAQSKADAQELVNNIQENLDNIQQNTEDITDLKSAVDSLESTQYSAFAEKTITDVAVASFDDGAENIPVKSLVVDIDPVQSGSGDPSPDNVRPITGWTGANVFRTGKNLFNKALPLTTGLIDNSGEVVANISYQHSEYYTPVQPATQYVFSGQVVNIGTYNSIGFYTQDKTFISRFVPSNSGVGAVFTTPTNCYYIRFNTGNSNNVDVDTIQLEQGSVATSYEPFGNTYDITFPSEAGTVYGGTLEVNEDGSGVLTVEYFKRTLAEMSWRVYSNAFYTNNANDYTKAHTNLDGVCNVYTTTADSDLDNGIGFNSHVLDGNNRIRIKDSRFTTTTELIAYLSEVGAECVTRFDALTYTLTVQQITTLLGTNNIWADTGDVDVTYRAMNNASAMITLTKALIAPVLDSMVADTALSVNDFRIVGDTLYKVTAPIASGGTLTVGTNVTATTIGEQISALLA